MQRTGFSIGVVTMLVVLLIVGLATPALAVSGPTQLGAAPLAQQATPTPTNNTTVQHERPDDVSADGDSQQVSQWLEGQLADRLEESSIELSQGQYEQAQGRLGDEYDSRLEQYVDVAGETENNADDRTAESFRESQEQQQSYTNATQSYRETYQEYQQAREQGNTSAARGAARELEAISDRVSTLNESLNRNYETITNQTGADTGTAQQSISNTTQNITTQQATVRSQTFVETRLAVETNGSTVAFDAPMAITGQLQTANGTVIANETIQIGVFNRTYAAQTDQNGTFSVQYRPVSLPVNATMVAVRYVPDSGSPYLGTAENVSVDVRQVSPSLDVSLSRSEARYGDRVETHIVATADGRPVPSLLLISTLGDIRITTETNQTGQAGVEQPVPAAVPAGDQPVRVARVRANRAIGPATVREPITITSTDTLLTVSANQSDDNVTVRGQLRTADGQGLAERSVTIAVGETVRSVDTDRRGRYRLRLRNVSTSAVANQSAVPVTARFDGSGTNLADSRVKTTIAFALSDGENSFPSLQLVLGVIIAVLGFGGVFVWVRRETVGDTVASAGDPTGPTATDSDGASQAHSLVDRARSALANDDAEHAAMAAYAAVRTRVQHETGLPDSLTHREFLAACEQEATVDVSTLSTLADAYERATFAGAITTDAASSAVEVATAVVSSDDNHE